MGGRGRFTRVYGKNRIDCGQCGSWEVVRFVGRDEQLDDGVNANEVTQEFFTFACFGILTTAFAQYGASSDTHLR